MLLYLVRHGQSTTNQLTASDLSRADGGLEYFPRGDRPWPSDRSIDPPLTSLGVMQAEAVAERLRGEALGHLLCSPLFRALQTAQIVGRASGLAPQAWTCLSEHRGVEGFRGIRRAEAEACFGECLLPEELGDEGWWPGHMEDDSSLWERAGQAAEALRSLAGSADNKVAVIAHGTFTSRLISRLMDCGPAPYSRFAMMNCSVTTLEVIDTKVRLLGANDVSHLPVSLRT